MVRVFAFILATTALPGLRHRRSASALVDTGTPVAATP